MDQTVEKIESDDHQQFQFVIKQEHRSPEHEESQEWTANPCHIEENPRVCIADDAAYTLLAENEGGLSFIQAAFPKAGETFLYDSQILGDAWANDHYEWISSSREVIPKDNPLMTKQVYYLKYGCELGNIEFQRVVYYLHERPNLILVSYFGDEKIYKGKRKRKSDAGDPEEMLSDGERRPTKKTRKYSKMSGNLFTGVRAKSMDIEEAADMLDTYEGCLSKCVPQHPKGGELYFYDTSILGETWKYDGYMWRNSGKRNIPKENPQYTKTFYTVRLDESSYDGCTAFQRVVFRAMERPNIILVQYTGDENIWQGAMLSKGTKAMKEHIKQEYEFTAEELENPPDPAATTAPSCEMDWHEAAQVLQKHARGESKHRPHKPKPGNAYIFHLKAKMKESWKYDGYEWQAQGQVYFPRERPKLSKKMFVLKTEKDSKGSTVLQKSVFSLLENIYVVLVHYHSIETTAVDKGSSEEPGNVESTPISEHEDSMEMASEESMIKGRSLRLQEVLDILNSYKGNLSHARAIRPKAGEIYLFDTSVIGEDWKCDDYLWRNSGTNFQPKKNPLIRKVFHSIRLDEKIRGGSKAFQKTFYSLLAQPNIVMVHYFGDETVYTPLMHGNRKKGSEEYKRTVPSVMKSIKQALIETTGSTPKFTLKHLEVAYNLEETPRNLDQIRNTKRLLAKKKLPSTKNVKTEPNNTLNNSTMDVLRYVISEEVKGDQSDLGKQILPGELVLMNSDMHVNQDEIVQFGSEEIISVRSNLKGEVIYSESDLKLEDTVSVLKEETLEQTESMTAAEEIVQMPAATTSHDNSGNQELPVEIVEESIALDDQDSQDDQDNISDEIAEIEQLESKEPQDIPEIETVAQYSGPNFSGAETIDLSGDPEATQETLRALMTKIGKSQSLVIQPLDPRPDVCEAQMELLKQQKRILALQEKKLLLEVKSLEQATASVSSSANEVMETASINDSANSNEFSDENFIIVQDPASLGHVDDSQIEHVIYIDGPAEGFSIEQYSEESANLQNQT